MPNLILRWTLSSCGALPIQSPRRMEMANGDGEGVGGIQGLGWRGEFEEAGDHMLDLLLLGASIADDRRLDCQRGVFGDFKAGGRSGQHGDSTDLAELQR